MNADAAIEIMRAELNGEGDADVTIQEIEQADRLGFEALERTKRIRDLPEEVRSMYPKECFELLPSEAE